MSTSVNQGTRVRVMNVTLNDTSPTAITINDKSVNTAYIQCRTAVAMQLYRESGDSEYFTIKANTVFELPTRMVENEPFYLQAASGTPEAEILLILE